MKHTVLRKIESILMSIMILLVAVSVLPIKSYAADAAANDGQMGRFEMAEEWIKNTGENADTSIYKSAPRSSSYNLKCGIDVSKWQGDIDWNAVKASGVQFAFVRVGYRGHDANLYEDPYFRQNIERATAVGIKVGVYIYSEAVTDAEAWQECDFVIDRVTGYNIELPIVIDYEYCSGSRADGCRLIDCGEDMATRTQVCKAFCYRAQMRGYIGCVYANKNTLNNIINGQEIANDGYKIWVAQYPYENADARTCYTYYPWWINSSYKGTYDFWQFTSSGTVVQGLQSASVDMNYWYDDGSLNRITNTSIYVVNRTNTHLTCGLVVDTNSPILEYRWLGYSSAAGGWFTMSDWTRNNPWLDWEADHYGDITVVGQVRIPSQPDNIHQSFYAMAANPYIKGICQMPNPGPEHGFLIGEETYDNPNQKYQYELLVYDCTSKTWNYSTGKTRILEGKAFWTIWTPQYGYYWTLFRIYDENGSCIDERCYGFQNI